MFPHTVPALSDDEVLPVPDYRIWPAQSVGDVAPMIIKNFLLCRNPNPKGLYRRPKDLKYSVS